jgi:hypothetical protein
MPTIDELPVATSVTAADEVLVSQSGTARSASVGTLLASTQPAILAPTGSLLGRTSPGAGGPEPITVGTGLALAADTVQANGTDHASFSVQSTLQVTDEAVLNSNGTPMLLQLSMLRGLFSAGSNVTIDASGVISSVGTSGSGATSGSTDSFAGLGQVATLAPTDLIAVSQGGIDHTISYANLLGGETIDEFAAAAPASDTDTLPVGQGGSTMLGQSFGAVWTWIQGHMPDYKLPVVEITVNTTLDGSAHNGRILICSRAVTLTHSANEGSGFFCKIINVSSANVTFDSGVVTTSGQSVLSPGQMAEVYCATYSGGTITYAWMSGPSASPVPGAVTGLTASAPTYFSISLSWSAPTTGGAATGYVVQYRQTNVGGTWFTLSSSVTNATISGLSASTEYDIEVIATNAAGSGVATGILNVTTAAAPVVAPGQVTGLTVSNATASTMALSWSAPASGGTPASYTVLYRQTTVGGAFSTLASSITSLSITASGLAASTGYDFEVYAVNSAGNGPASSIATGMTLIAAPGTPTGLTAGSVTQTTAVMSWTAPSSGGTVASYTVQYRITNSGNAWTTVTGLTGTSTTLSPLAAGIEYDVQVAAVNNGGASGFTAITTTTTAPAVPGTPTGLTAGSSTAPTSTTATQVLSWTAGVGGTPAAYAVRYSVHGASAWTTISGITGTSTTITGLTASTSYDFEVQATNATGTSAWSSPTTASTAALSAYLLSQTFYGGPGQTPAIGYTAAAGTNGIPAAVTDNSTSAGSNPNHTAPAAVNFAWSTSNTVQPTAGMQAATIYDNGGYQFWTCYVNGPTTPGTYYLWAIGYSSSGAVVATTVTTGLVFT